jgi:transcription elongation factor GreA
MGDDLDVKKRVLKDEIEKLKHEFKVELPQKISEARAYGDLKENAEYHAARERQSFVKARISQLSEQLSKLHDMNMGTIPEDKVGYGSSLTVYDIDSEDTIELTLVSPNEVDPSNGKISLSSPIGAALNNRSAGDSVEITIPAGKKRYLIKKLTTIHGNEFIAE